MPGRFLEYSLRHGRKVRVILTDGEKGLTVKNILVCGLTRDSVSYLSAANKKKPVTIPLNRVLSASYARGDDGDTLKNAQREEPDEDERTRTGPESR